MVLRMVGRPMAVKGPFAHFLGSPFTWDSISAPGEWRISDGKAGLNQEDGSPPPRTHLETANMKGKWENFSGLPKWVGSEGVMQPHSIFSFLQARESDERRRQKVSISLKTSKKFMMCAVYKRSVE
ncbi:hypothetical protein DdX_06591 [Ditylenchus destructor]|uniref:Uncharacterized protein n=1 Tax=Ditylenchus destructor TaxID=166010 RepID=A0AAD4R2M5_9BILA|nr:hypothetical protein DdX_06591 [Ditylenchus destructor]